MISEKSYEVLKLAHKDLETLIQTRLPLKKYNQQENTNYSFHPKCGQWRFITGILMPKPRELCDLLGIKIGDGLSVVKEGELEQLHEQYDLLEKQDIRYKAREEGAVGLCHFKQWQEKQQTIYDQQFKVYKGVLFVQNN